MAKADKKQTAPAAPPAPEKVEKSIDIVRGERRRQCKEKDFSYFEQRGWKKAAPETAAPANADKSDKETSAPADK